MSLLKATLASIGRENICNACLLLCPSFDSACVLNSTAVYVIACCYCQFTIISFMVVNCGNTFDFRLLILSPARPLPTPNIAPTAPTVLPQSSQRNSVTKRCRQESRHGGSIVERYRPDYTWNRGGRMKEMRIRCEF